MGFEGKREPDIKKVRRFLLRLLSKRLTPAAQDYAPPRSSLSESRVTVRCSDLLEMSRLTLVLKSPRLRSFPSPPLYLSVISFPSLFFTVVYDTRVFSVI